MTYWQSLCQHVVFLMATAPLFGAMMVLTTRKLGIALTRRTALSNACVTAALAAVMVANYDPGLTTSAGRSVTLQMTTAFRWIGGETGQSPIIHFAVGADGLNLWFLALTALMMLPAIALGPQEEGTSSFYALLLILQSLLMTAFGALDVVLLAAALLGCAIPLAILVGLWGRMERRAAAKSFALGHAAGGMLLLTGLLGFVADRWERDVQSASEGESVRPTFALLRVVESPPRTRRRGETVRELPASWRIPTIVLAAGIGLLTPLAGRHVAWRKLLRESPAGLRVVLLGSMLNLGVYAAARCLVPAMNLDARLLGIPLFILVAANALVIALQPASSKEELPWIASLSLTSLACAGACSLTRGGMTGALSIAVGVSLAAALICLGRHATPIAKPEVSVLRAVPNSWQRVSSVAMAALLGLPGLCVFPGLWLLVSSAASESRSTTAAVLMAAAIAFLAIRTIAANRRPRQQEPHGMDVKDSQSGLAPSLAWSLALVLAGIVLTLGIVPRLVTERAIATIERTLR